MPNPLLRPVAKLLYRAFGLDVSSKDRYRRRGYRLLRGTGLEIGPGHNPSKLPERCMVKYFDTVTKKEAAALFHEIPSELFVEPDYLGDLDKDGLQQFSDNQFDFVVINHVVEHVANPIRVIYECLRITRPHGHIVISCPDKRYTFDKPRRLTTLNHLVEEYRSGVDEVTDAHYEDFLAFVHPEFLVLPEAQFRAHVQGVRRRREHAHVWDSGTFRTTILHTLVETGQRAVCRMESTGRTNHFEYFGVWEKLPPDAT